MNRILSSVVAVLIVSIFFPSLQAEELDAAESPSQARQRGDEKFLEEVIVNARRRDESLQETPVAVSAFSADRMEEAGIYSLTDLEQHVPNMQFNRNTSKDVQVFIRGMGQRTDVTLFDPSVGIYLNNILIPRHDSALLETVDISSVQVLRGPQGTLFGKNNTGGAILFASRSPSLEEWDGAFFTRAGNAGRLDGRLSGNIPLLENRLGLRFALSSSSLDGYLDNEEDGRTFADEDRRAVSGRLLWLASESFSVDIFGFWSSTDELGLGSNCVLQNPDASMPNLTFPGQPGYAEACAQSQNLAAKRKIAINARESRFSIDNTMLALTLDWQASDAINLKSITGLNRWDNIVRSDDADSSLTKAVFNGTLPIRRTFAASGLEPPDENRWQITEEIQLTGNAFNETLDYTVGLFGSIEQIDSTPVGQLVGEKGIGGVKPSLITGLAADNGLVLPPGFDALQGLSNDTADAGFVIPFVEWLGTESDLRNENMAIFAEATWSPLDWLQLTAGGRYTEEKRHRDMFITDVNHDEVGQRIGATYSEEFGVYSPITRQQFDNLENDPRELPIFGVGVVSGSRVFREITPSATISVLANESWLDRMRLDSFMTYVTASKGFKAGGFDAKGTDLVVVKPEKVTNLEWGFKLDGLDNRLRLNGSVFHTEWRDMQVQNAELGDSLAGTEILLFFTNAGQAVTKGVELEASMALGRWFITANASYLDAAYNEFIGNVVTPFVGEFTVDRTDEPLFMAPELTYSISVQYEWLSPVGLVTPMVSFSHRDKVYTGLDQLADEYESSWADEIDIWNFRLSYIPADMLRLSFYVNNVTDDFYYASGLTNSEALGSAQMVQGPERQMGLEVHYDF